MITLMERPATYIIRHRPTGVFYIGSTGNMLSRAKSHVETLNKGRHANNALQRVFNDKNELDWEVVYKSSLTEARETEQTLLDKFHGTRGCCNIGTGAHCLWGGGMPAEQRAAISRASKAQPRGPMTASNLEAIKKANTGLKRSPETIEKMRASKKNKIKVSIDGVHYESISAAARAHNVTNRTIYARCNSKSPMFETWVI